MIENQNNCVETEFSKTTQHKTHIICAQKVGKPVEKKNDWIKHSNF